MTLRLRHLRLRAETSSGPFGADIPFSTGLNVLWADNTKGKSTCLQGLLYALGQLYRQYRVRATLTPPCEVDVEAVARMLCENELSEVVKST